MQSENTRTDFRNNTMISNPVLTKWKQISCWEGDVESWEMHYPEKFEARSDNRFKYILSK